MKNIEDNLNKVNQDMVIAVKNREETATQLNDTPV